jgi:predicted membrane protein
MSSVTRKCHMKALSENLELGLIGGLLASSVDTLWVIMDMIHNGLQWHYPIILIGLLLSTIILVVALVRHHRNNVKQQLGSLYAFKKSVVRCKRRNMK